MILNGSVKIYDASDSEIPESQIGNPYYFTGRRLDEETGLYYYRNRYYSPELGRFTSLDPLGYVDSMNLYAYAMSDPINKDDPFGLMEPGAMEEQQRALCGGTPDCAIDMTPNTPEEGVFQDIVGAGLNSMIASAIAVPLANAYGGIVVSSLKPIVSTAVAEVASYGSAAATIVKTAITEIATIGIENYIRAHPQGSTEFAAGFIGGFAQSYGKETTGMPILSVPQLAGYGTGYVSGSLLSFYDDIISKSDQNEMKNPKKGE